MNAPWPTPETRTQARDPATHMLAQIMGDTDDDPDDFDVRMPYEPDTWEPGMPLYIRGATCVPRLMIDLPEDETVVEDIKYSGAAWCARCLVAWGKKRWDPDVERYDLSHVTRHCWMCGRFGNLDIGFRYKKRRGPRS